MVLLLRVENNIVFTNYRRASILSRVLTILSIVAFVLSIFLKHIVDFIHILLVHLSVVSRLLLSVLGPKGRHYASLRVVAIFIYIHFHTV